MGPDQKPAQIWIDFDPHYFKQRYRIFVKVYLRNEFNFGMFLES